MSWQAKKEPKAAGEDKLSVSCAGTVWVLFKPWLVHFNYFGFGFNDVFCLSEGAKAFPDCIEDGNMSDDEGEGEKDKEKKKKLKKRKVNTLRCLITGECIQLWRCVAQWLSALVFRFKPHCSQHVVVSLGKTLHPKLLLWGLPTC